MPADEPPAQGSAPPLESGASSEFRRAAMLIGAAVGACLVAAMLSLGTAFAVSGSGDAWGHANSHMRGPGSGNGSESNGRGHGFGLFEGGQGDSENGESRSHNHPTPGSGGPLAGLRGLGGMAELLQQLQGLQHGTFVSQDSVGTQRTLAVIKGNVTAVDATSIAIKSDDNFAQQFVVNSKTSVRDGFTTATIAAIKVGSEVTAVGTVSGATATATIISTNDPLSGGS